MRFFYQQNNDLRSIFAKAAWPLLCVLTVFYFGFHTISGERGLLAFFNANRKLEQLKTELSDMQLRRAEMEKKISLMSSNSLDLDMLDEQARIVLGLAGKDEVVVFSEP